MIPQEIGTETVIKTELNFIKEQATAKMRENKDNMVIYKFSNTRDFRENELNLKLSEDKVELIRPQPKASSKALIGHESNSLSLLNPFFDKSESLLNKVKPSVSFQVEEEEKVVKTSNKPSLSNNIIEEQKALNSHRSRPSSSSREGSKGETSSFAESSIDGLDEEEKEQAS